MGTGDPPSSAQYEDRGGGQEAGGWGHMGRTGNGAKDWGKVGGNLVALVGHRREMNISPLLPLIPPLCCTIITALLWIENGVLMVW